MQAQAIEMSSLTDAVKVENLRSHKRFMIRDKRLWQLKIQNKTYPLDWVHDISRSGLQIRQGAYRGFQMGDEIQLELKFLGSTILDVRANVVWLQSDREHLNMNILGLEFIEFEGRPLKKWVSRQMLSKQALQLSEEVHNLQIKEDNEEKQRRKFRLSEAQWAFATVLPFVAGYVMSYFG